MTRLIKRSTKDIHSFLNGVNGLVVHFSGCPKGIGLGKKSLPEDLKDVLSGHVTGQLSCSVVIPGGFYSVESKKGNATGTIGVILDMDGSNLFALSHCDAGSYVDGNNNRKNEGKDIRIKDLGDSLSNRITYNEWVVKSYDIKGMFIFNPDYILIRKMMSIPDFEGFVEDDSEIGLYDVCNIFPHIEIFAFKEGNIAKLDRGTYEFIVETERFYG